MIAGRFAPTPSGLMHLGNARTALLAWLQIRRLGGSFLLRMEDIDGPRSRPDYAEAALRDLRWLGLDWDEGPDRGGPRGPYTQSERHALYEQALERLRGQGLLYPCYCSRAELAAVASAPHGLASEGPAYPGTCRCLTEEERRERALRKPPSLRFAVPPGRIVRFDDECAGPQETPPGAGGDFVVRRADGIFSYQLAVAVDDAAMGITHVLRGSDLLDSTPRQLLLLEALGLAPPRYAHVPLLMGPDGKRLAKRHGGTSLQALREAGVRPERVVGLLARWSGLLERAEPVRPRELVEAAAKRPLPALPIVVREEELSGMLEG
ncbi:tRNA glutamyl-Q(34) synthetase GluQRS [Paenibacillus albicereus]|uniref:Glutamyl-Q tRNA(Asp) synthetase n=1 Tax=Paenibacillus albicereus TaxID=2726185 RepID=A0A6H2GXS0_9BACL|nr:tRNA glutamyl-Q(34) synthetase GluQRS [Paenibacillus albicereus]QJC52197.1 tRNA glutamyl-Q(34) synthetase GluQRS [Paenibacillus albicereus]